MNKRILIAPLNWGLGHAARCIPIIEELINHNFEPIIGSDGNALSLLKKEFPNLQTFELPSYNVNYSKKGTYLKLKLISNIPSIAIAIKNENNFIKKFVKTHNIDGVISDNRLGLYCKQVPCVIMTHQLNVLSGNTTYLSTKLHQKFINKFDECWVPDFKGDKNLSGILGHPKKISVSKKYIGPLSRFNKISTEIKHDLLVLLSGPEPQRSLLENKLLAELKKYKGNIVFIKGKIESVQKVNVENHITIYNYMTTSELEKTINKSQLVLSRSGYTTIMDLAKLEKKAFFIPTPGQYEQIYLAKKLHEDGIAPFCLQENFTVEKLNEVKQHKGFKDSENHTNFKNLFSLFERE
ncbi:MAG: glycosyltransferase [Flavobacteriaceae bacterium]|nr:glycosyltransferase [Flavobacteriaceae bacterium]